MGVGGQKEKNLGWDIATQDDLILLTLKSIQICLFIYIPSLLHALIFIIYHISFHIFFTISLPPIKLFIVYSQLQVIK